MMRFRTLGGAIAVALVIAAPAGAAGDGSTLVTTMDVTGSVFTCPDATYTVTSGTVTFVLHDSFAANGSEHITGTIVPNGVTLSDGTTGADYRIGGASWFGGNLGVGQGGYVFTDTSFFVIRGPTGPVAKVAAIEHASSGGSNFSFQFDACTAPEG